MDAPMLEQLEIIRDELQCFICKRVLEDPQCLTCNHNFCRVCVENELRKAVSKCARCSIPIRPTDVRRNQFLDGLVAEWKFVEAAIDASRPSSAKRRLSIEDEPSPQIQAAASLPPATTLPHAITLPPAPASPSSSSPQSESLETESPELYPMLPTVPTANPLIVAERQSALIIATPPPAAVEEPRNLIRPVDAAQERPSPARTVASTPATPPNALAPLMTTPEIRTYMDHLRLLGQNVDDGSQVSVAGALDFSAASTPSNSFPPESELAPPSQLRRGIAMPQSPIVSSIPVPPAAPPTLPMADAPPSIAANVAEPSASTPPPADALPPNTKSIILVPKSPPTKRAFSTTPVTLHAVMVPSTQPMSPEPPSPVPRPQDDADAEDDDEEAVDETERQTTYDPCMEETEVPVHAMSQSQLCSELPEAIPAPAPRPCTPAHSAHAAKRFVAADLSKEEKRMLLESLEDLGNARFGRDFARYLDPKTGRLMTDVTHVITKAAQPRRCTRSVKYMLGLAHHCWIVDFGWVEASAAAGYWVDETPFEMDGDVFSSATGQPRRSRLAPQPSTTHIFANMHFVQLCPTTSFEPQSAMQLEPLVVAFGGTFEGFVFAKGLHEKPQASATTVGIVSKSLSPSTCKELWTQYNMPIVRVTWIPDSISNLQRT
ncbi:hypothetical protein, variant [Saprolegnia diclina VS20]|uniref:RING-type E3 ubiquitin transferase BRCA1 n=1 Tax=Saprolegnia diclina (strain VS20) TaxID=1156394 RepID=T0QY22_SAPDV|nr:hypothetical protein, variant [Saprolegnia diclina VS20]EQC38935.1 hypothetical protein, variant [Saprolegnia diclina VS20]|eukprot:XP_008607759.1 hypothetical protein, variant [Saprolegnia diclina VS20]